MPANSFAGSSSTRCPKASIASATTACSPARTAPRPSCERANSSEWQRLWPRRRPKSIQRWRSHSPSLAPAVAAACSSSRPSRPAASHATGQPCLSSPSGSTPHERGHDITHPHRQARSSLVTTRPRRRSTGQLPDITFHSAIFPEGHRHGCSSEPETHQRPPSPDRHALAPSVHRQRRDQIPIARASPSAPHLPRVPSLEAFGRRPRCKPNRRDGPSSETLHRSGHSIASSLLRSGLFGQPRFPKTLNKQLCVFGGPGDTRRYCIGGIDLKHTRRRVVRLSVTSEMGEGGREEAVSCQIGEILTKGFLQYAYGLVKAAKLDKGLPNARKRHV